MRTDPESAKKTDNLSVFFALLGFSFVKADHRMLMKLIPGHISYSKMEIPQSEKIMRVRRATAMRVQLASLAMPDDGSALQVSELQKQR